MLSRQRSEISAQLDCSANKKKAKTCTAAVGIGAPYRVDPAAAAREGTTSDGSEVIA